MKSQSLLTDLYQITMAYGYWNHSMHQRRATFHLFYRSPPFGGRYVVAAGLDTAIEWLDQFEFAPSDIEYLRSLEGNDNRPLLKREFLDELREMKMTVDVDALPEGSLVFPHEPILRVQGPLWQCQWIETVLLTIINFQSLIATKAARLRAIAGDDSILEFGLRRAQGIDGGMSASRAAYIGGCDATSNVLAGKEFGIPVRGTHAHSWVMSFDSELESFRAYAQSMPNNCIFLVDTYNTVEGVRQAIQVGMELRDQGHRMIGIRLDSGDMTRLSIEARRLLDDAGFRDAQIVASNDLDEATMRQMKADGACVSIWGIGTKLVTAYEQPALGGVYKLSGIEDVDGNFSPRIKLSETDVKTSVPGVLQVRRYYKDETAIGDILYSEHIGAPEHPLAASPSGTRAPHDFSRATSFADLLVPIYRDGNRVRERETLGSIRDRVHNERARFRNEMNQLEGAPPYPFGLEERLGAVRDELIQTARMTSASP